jgi:hypothetical protein
MTARHARIALAATVVAAAVLPSAPASAAQKYSGVRAPAKPCAAKSARPVAHIAIPGAKPRKCSKKATRTKRPIAHIAPRFQRLPLGFDDAESSSRPVARAAR